jgi:hypothetical protein
MIPEQIFRMKMMGFRKGRVKKLMVFHGNKDVWTTCVESNCHFTITGCVRICYSPFIFGGVEIFALLCNECLYGVWKHLHSHSIVIYEL